MAVRISTISRRHVGISGVRRARAPGVFFRSFRRLIRTIRVAFHASVFHCTLTIMSVVSFASNGSVVAQFLRMVRHYFPRQVRNMVISVTYTNGVSKDSSVQSNSSPSSRMKVLWYGLSSVFTSYVRFLGQGSIFINNGLRRQVH